MASRSSRATRSSDAGAFNRPRLLSARTADFAPGSSGLLALDWWNGNRSTLGRSDLSGLIVGATLSTRAEDIFHALVEATALGMRAIVESFTDQGLSVSSIVAGGGLTRNAMLMQIYADVTGGPIAVAGAAQASASGAAMLAGRRGGGKSRRRVQLPGRSRGAHGVASNTRARAG